MPRKLKFRSLYMKNGEEFAVKFTDAGNINLWHITEEHTKLYTFEPLEGRFDRYSCWCEKMCKELLKDLSSDKPSVTVLRYAIDGCNIFPIGADLKHWPVPNTPPRPELTEQQKEEYKNYLEKQARKK